MEQDFIEWSESMSVGVPWLDHDHQVLVKLINLLHQQANTEDGHETLGTVLNSLLDYTQLHFSREEQVLQACNYPSLKEHKQQHESLVEQVVNIAHRFFENKEAVIEDDVVIFLRNWLVDHILQQDMGYRPYAENHMAVLQLDASLKRGEGQPRVVDKEGLIPVSINWTELTFLLISKKKNFRRLISTILELANVKGVHHASDLDGGTLLLTDFAPDLIVWDRKYSDQEAIQSFIQLRETKGSSTCDIPVLFIMEKGTELEVAAVDKVNYVEEPLGLKRFFEAVEKTLTQS